MDVKEKIDKFVKKIREKYGDTITFVDFEDIYEEFDDICVEKYGKPERNFIAVVGFGNRCRKKLRKLLKENNILLK